MQNLYKQLLASTDKAKTSSLLVQIKQTLYTDPTIDQVVIREILELALYHSLLEKDIPAFESYFAQLKQFYSASTLPASQRMFPILGLNLLRLLAQNRISDFHTELEGLPFDQLTNIYIKHPIQTEQFLMEGSYNKVWNSRSNVPAQEYLFFIDILMSTIRNEIASCSEKCYESLLISDAATLLYFKNAEQVIAFANERKWSINITDNKIYFDQSTGDIEAIPSQKMIRLAMGYARELERIV